jgi:hypothetical protein
MFVLYACCDAELESSIKVISGDLLDPFYRNTAYIPNDIEWSVWIVPGTITE